jgi:uncharacterized protein YjbJ (UPF0337 family)
MSEAVNKTKGRVKQAVGSLTGDEALKREGVRDENKGRIEGAIGHLKDAVKGAVKGAKEALKEVKK